MLKNPKDDLTPVLTTRSLKIAGVVAVLLITISSIQVLRHYALQRPDQIVRPDKEAVLSAVQNQEPAAPRHHSIQDETLRREIEEIERRLVEARLQKERDNSAETLFDKQRSLPQQHFVSRREALERDIATLGVDQPGLAAPLKERLEAMDEDAPQR